MTPGSTDGKLMGQNTVGNAMKFHISIHKNLTFYMSNFGVLNRTNY